MRTRFDPCGGDLVISRGNGAGDLVCSMRFCGLGVIFVGKCLNWG